MKENIKFEDFEKLDIRVGTITKAEEVPKSKKLLLLSVFFGAEIGERTILSGIKDSYSPDNMVGLSVMAIVNLEPRKMMGIESHGMLLAGELESVDGVRKVSLASCNACKEGTVIG